MRQTVRNAEEHHYLARVERKEERFETNFE
jgi:hypothetical protein